MKLQSRSFLPLAILVGIFVMIPVFIWGIPVGADLQNHLRFLLPFYDEVSLGNLAPAWLAESNFGFGDPRFRFYPPLLYYVFSLFQLLIRDWYITTVSVFTFISILGAVGVYFWVKQTLSKETAFLSAAVFAIAPYHLTQFYQASLWAEVFAIALLPFCFLFVERLLDPQSANNYRRNILDVIGLGISFSLVIMTHIPTTVIAGLSLGLYSLLLTDWKRYKKGLVFCAVGILTALLLSAWFWVKMVSELGWIQAGTGVSSPHYDYRNNFIFSPFALVSLNTWYANLNAVLTICLLLPGVLIFRQIFRRDPDNFVASFFSAEKWLAARRLFAVLTVTVVTFLMTTDLSRPLWLVIPKLKDIQFPFRWLTIVSILMCPLVALSIQFWRDRLRQKNLRPVHLVLIAAFVCSVGYTFYDLVITSSFHNREIFTGNLEPIRGARSFRDWLPLGAKELKDLTLFEGQANTGGRNVVVKSFRPEKRVFHIEQGEEAEVRIRAYNYPLWHAYMGQAELPINKTEDGVIAVTIPPDELELELVFERTRPERIALWMSVLGLVILFGLIGFSKILFRKK